jgi:hypothetical protein
MFNAARRNRARKRGAVVHTAAYSSLAQDALPTGGALELGSAAKPLPSPDVQQAGSDWWSMQLNDHAARGSREPDYASVPAADGHDDDEHEIGWVQFPSSAKKARRKGLADAVQSAAPLLKPPGGKVML